MNEEGNECKETLLFNSSFHGWKSDQLNDKHTISGFFKTRTIVSSFFSSESVLEHFLL